VRDGTLPALVVALVALLAFALAAGTVGDPATTGTAEERGVERDAEPRTDFPRVEGGGGLGGIRGLLGGYVPAVPRWALVAAVGGAALLLVVLWRTAGGDAPEAASTERQERGTPVEGAPAGGGPAPDWADVPAENGVFRAWRRLAEHVDARRPGHRTPADYAELARESGVEGGAVDELTALFRRVRYGPAGPTPERERRAREALSRAGLDGDGEDPAEEADTGSGGGASEGEANDGGAELVVYVPSGRSPDVQSVSRGRPSSKISNR
jgi:hypothetical protein